MISQQGRVVATPGDDVVVNIGGVSGCPTCDAGKGCGAGIFGRLLRNQTVDIRVRNDIGATFGQNVSVGIPEQRFLSLVFRLYVWPLIAALLGVITGFLITSIAGGSDVVSDLLGLVCGVIAAGLAFLYSRKKLREFPFAAEVNLLETANGEAPCAGTGSGSVPATVNNELNQER